MLIISALFGVEKLFFHYVKVLPFCEIESMVAIFDSGYNKF